MTNTTASSKPVQYDKLEPFIRMDKALSDGRVRVFCPGVTLDAPTLAEDVLTIAIIPPDTYGELFVNAVETNSKGSMSA